MSDKSLIKKLEGISFLHDIDPAHGTDCKYRRSRVLMLQTSCSTKASVLNMCIWL